MPLPEDFLQDLKMRSDIVDVVSGYVNLRRRGRNMVGLCPFHGEKTPSFNLYPENGSFYCFGCGAGGDVITFIRRIENLDYMEAVRFLAQRAGMQMPENSRDEGLSRLRTRIYEMNREAARFYHQALIASAEGKRALGYLRGRALTDKTIRHFGLGYAPASRFALVDALRAKGYKDDEIISANLAFKSRSGRAVDRFTDRAMFPIIDLRGNVIAFGGRIMGDGKPKYLNTSDTMVFKKSSNLFALNFAKNSGEKRLILAEGYMDVIALHQAGFTNAVATLGTALTSEQARLLARYAAEIVISYDADEAGQKAAGRAIPLLREAGLLVRVLSIAGGKDPDEFIRSHGEEGPVRFRQLLDASGNDVDYRLQKLRASCNMETTDGKVAYLSGAAAILATLDNRIEQELYAGKLSEEIGVEKSSVLYQVDKLVKKRDRDASQKQFRELQRDLSGGRDTVNPERSQNLRAARAEEALIAYLINHPDMAKNISMRVPADKFCTSFNRRVYERVLERALSGKETGIDSFSEDFSMEEISRVAKILANSPPGAETAQAAEEYVSVLLTEREKIKTEEAATADVNDIASYLQRMREQKK